MKRRGGLRRRFLIGALTSAAVSLLVFGGVVFAQVALEDDDHDEDGDGDRIDRSHEVGEAVTVVGRAMLIAAPAGVLAAVVAAAVLARRTARPIEQAIEAAQRTSAHDLSRRLEVPAEDGELRELVVAQNALFERLDHGFHALAGFAADASHELRTPLAVMATELEVALRSPRDRVDWEAQARGTLGDIRRLADVVDGLLSLARAGVDAPGARRPTSLLELIDGVVEPLIVAAGARGVALTGPESGPDRVVELNPATIETAVRNLVENALRHARTRVDVALVAADARTVHVIVDDDGPGLGDQPERLFAPLVRGDGADRHVGAGLGLAIARRIAEAHGGALLAGRSPSGGARITLTLAPVS